MLPLGIGKNAYRMQEDILFCKERGNANSTFNELVVMSPFLSESVIADFNLTDRALSDCKRTLVTRRSELGKLKASDVDNFTIYALKDEIIDGEEEISDELADKKKQDIHAKIYLRRKYSDVDLYLGSMNASYSASYQDRDKSWKRRFKGYKYNHHMKIEFAADNKRLGQVLYALAHSSLRPEFSIEYTVADVEKCKNELLHKAIEDSIQKAQVLTTAANVKLGEIQAIDYSWGEIDFVTKPLNEMRLMECTECEMSAPGAYDIDIEADDINVTDTATVIWEIA